MLRSVRRRGLDAPEWDCRRSGGDDTGGAVDLSIALQYCWTPGANHGTEHDDDALLDFAAERIARVRYECLELGLRPGQIAELMMDDALLGLVAEGRSESSVQQAFRDFANRRVPEWFKKFWRTAKILDQQS